MNGDQKKWAGRVLRFAVSGALLVAPAACGGSSEEEHHTNEPVEEIVNEPRQPTGGGEDTGGEGEGEGEGEPPDGPNVNEPAPSE